jgi:hypothetical protein
MAALNPLAEIFHAPEEAVPLSPPRLSIRVGVAGHLDLRGQEQEIEKIVRDLLLGIIEVCKGLEAEYLACFRKPDPAKSGPCFRLMTSLAAGGDQLVANIAHDLGYQLQVILPTDRDEFRTDIITNTPPNSSVNPASLFDDFLAKKETVVFELDGKLDRGGQAAQAKNNQAYAAAARVVLAHSDLLLVILSRKAKAQYGGTLWLARRAMRAEVPLLLIPIEEPDQAEIVWHRDGTSVRRYLYPPHSDEDARCAVRAVLRPLLLLPQALRPQTTQGLFQRYKAALRRLLTRADARGPLPDAGRFERVYRERLPIKRNRRYWDERWGAADSQDCQPHSAGVSRRQIDSDFRDLAVWADHRASVYGEMYRGAFSLTAVLGATAVSFALVNVMFTGWSVFAKSVELVLLSLMLTVYFRGRRYGWKERWLNYRRLERHLNAAAWLALLGKTVRLHVPAHGSTFHDRAAWENWFTRAVLRQATLPEMRIGREYLNTVRALVLAGLVRDQIGYYRLEIEEHTYTEHRLEQLGKHCLTWAFLGTLGFLSFHIMHELHWLDALPGYQAVRGVVFAASAAAGVEQPGQELVELGRRLAIVLGAGLPAWAGALAAIRSQGEHNQIALRYGGQIAALTRIEHSFDLLTDEPSKRSPLRLAPLAWKSTELMSLMLDTTNVLTDEVHHWHSMLYTKEIEPT